MLKSSISFEQMIEIKSFVDLFGHVSYSFFTERMNNIELTSFVAALNVPQKIKVILLQDLVHFQSNSDFIVHCYFYIIPYEKLLSGINIHLPQDEYSLKTHLRLNV